MKKRSKEIKRKVLGIGYPWFFNSDKSGPYDSIKLYGAGSSRSKLLALKIGELGNWKKIKLIAEYENP